MNKIRVLSVFGTRPEAIKMCPLVKLLEKDKRFESIVCITAQHREMIDSVLEIFNIKPDYDLNIMSHGQSIVDISNKVLKGVYKIIEDIKPNIVLVHGDTSTTLNSALAGFYNNIPIGHIEAGLRTHNIYSPFPEEVNRRLTGALATLHFAPTIINQKNLLDENINPDKIYITGNTVIDALISVIDKNLIFKQDILNNLDYKNKKIILLTTHRRENWGTPMENIFEAIIKLIEKNDDVEIIFPMHKNPSIIELSHKYFDKYKEKVHLIESLEYVEFANLMERVYLIMTDSGGIQEEAPTLGKPVIVLRTETERPEAIEAGTIVLGGIETENIYKVSMELLNDTNKYENMSKSSNPYGDGRACEKIIEAIYNYFKNIKS